MALGPQNSCLCSPRGRHCHGGVGDPRTSSISMGEGHQDAARSHPPKWPVHFRRPLELEPCRAGHRRHRRHPLSAGSGVVCPSGARRSGDAVLPLTNDDVCFSSKCYVVVDGLCVHFFAVCARMHAVCMCACGKRERERVCVFWVGFDVSVRLRAPSMSQYVCAPFPGSEDQWNGWQWYRVQSPEEAPEAESSCYLHRICFLNALCFFFRRIYAVPYDLVSRLSASSLRSILGIATQPPFTAIVEGSHHSSTAGDRNKSVQVKLCCGSTTTHHFIFYFLFCFSHYISLFYLILLYFIINFLCFIFHFFHIYNLPIVLCG